MEKGDGQIEINTSLWCGHAKIEETDGRDEENKEVNTPEIAMCRW